MYALSMAYNLRLLSADERRLRLEECWSQLLPPTVLLWRRELEVVRFTVVVWCCTLLLSPEAASQQASSARLIICAYAVLTVRAGLDGAAALYP